MKKANLFGWFIFVNIVRLFSFLKGQRFKSRLKIKGPAITLSNHTSFYDFLYTINALYPLRVSFLASKKMFYDPVLGFFLRHRHSIPKALLEADPVATMQGLKVLKNNGILGFFPEGQISPSGTLVAPSPAITKLLKKAKVPVYVIRHEYAGYVNPPWTKKTFKGKIKTTVAPLFSVDDVQAMSEEELYTKMCEALTFSPHVPAPRFKVNNISGLENILYECPSCRFEGLKTVKTTLYCPHCDFKVALSPTFKLGEADIAYFYDKQRTSLAQKSRDPAFFLESTVSVESFVENRVKTVGSGILTLNKDVYSFTGTLSGEVV